jgi:hypothetical protein
MGRELPARAGAANADAVGRAGDEVETSASRAMAGKRVPGAAPPARRRAS